MTLTSDSSQIRIDRIVPESDHLITNKLMGQTVSHQHKAVHWHFFKK